MTKAEKTKAIEARIKEEIEAANEIRKNGIDSPDEMISYSLARGARWALEWVLSLK